jgi:hypothetical protein
MKYSPPVYEKLKYFFADGTKTHSQEPEMNKNDVNVILGHTNQGEKILLDLQVNEKWKTSQKEIKKLNILNSLCFFNI